MCCPVEAHRAHAMGVQLGQFPLRNIITKNGNTAAILRRARDGCEHGTMVVSVRTTLYDHCACDSEGFPYLFKLCDRRFGRIEGAVLREWIAIKRAKDMTMAI